MKRDKFEIIAKTFQGVEEQLAEEIKTIGGEEIALGRRMVSFKGDNEMLYRANFFCRTALRILKPIYKFEAKDTDELYEKVKNFNW
ncbi:MAG: THUMP domain-containing protein, partial [Bacteroidales bacterium]